MDPLTNEPMSEKLNQLGVATGASDAVLKYLINSKKFNVKSFLRDIHNLDSFSDLSNELDNLDQLIQVQSGDMKNLVEENFTKYVRIKNRLDKIYNQFGEMKGNESLDVDRLNEKVDESIRITNLKLKPLIDTSKKIENFKSGKRFIEENKRFFNLPRELKKKLIHKDYSSFIIEYTNGLKLYQEFKVRSDNAGKSLRSIEFIWNEVENIMKLYKEQIWEKLLDPSSKLESQEYFLPLFSKLLDLDNTEENPITKWIFMQLSTLETELKECSTNMISKILSSQKNILDNADTEEPVNMTPYLSINQFFQQSNQTTLASVVSAVDPFQDLTDFPNIVEMWLLILKYINQVDDICNKFIELWDHIEKFLDGTYQNMLLNDKRKDNILIGDSNTMESYKFILNLDQDVKVKIRTNGETFIKLVSEKLKVFFNSSQESLPMMKPAEKESGLPSDYGFVPPNANGLSSLRYLPKIMKPLLECSTQLAQLNITPKSVDILRNLASIIISRCVGLISSIKLRDISNFYKLENWDVYKTGSDRDSNIEYEITQFPEIVRCFQEYSLSIIRDFLFSFERLPVLNGISIVSYPSKQLLTGVEIQQIISLEAVLESILKNAAKDKDNPRSAHTILTLTNLQYIREVTFPQILQYFDDAFEARITEKPLEIFNLLSKMESSIFGNYLSDLKITLRDILEEKFKEIDWPGFTSNSFRAGDYILEALMLLVTIHSECFRIGPQLINKIIKETQIFIARYLFEAFKPYIGNLSSDGLLQVTVDLQFFQKVLGPLLEKDTQATLTACLQNCFQNDITRMNRCIQETEPIVSANFTRTSIQFAAFH